MTTTQACSFLQLITAFESAKLTASSLAREDALDPDRHDRVTWTREALAEALLGIEPHAVRIEDVVYAMVDGRLKVFRNVPDIGVKS